MRKSALFFCYLCNSQFGFPCWKRLKMKQLNFRPMKKLLLAMMLIVAPYATWAQGWPEKYGGVMLQGFYWDSYEDTKWTNLESQADVLSKYFDLIWVPQSGWCNGDYQMGYAPV